GRSGNATASAADVLDVRDIHANTDSDANTDAERDSATQLLHHRQRVAEPGGPLVLLLRRRQLRDRFQPGHGQVQLQRHQQSAAPDGDAVADADVVDAAGFQVAADPAGLDVDDGAGAEGDGVHGAAGGGDGFVQADRGAELAGQGRVVADVGRAQGLFEHD